MNGVKLTDAESAAWRRYVHECCGVHLEPTQAYLIETRLAGLLRETGADTWDHLLRKVRSAPATFLTQVVNAITTNETSFFRDTAPFELLQHKLFPELIDRRRRAGFRQVPIRVLSAACSTGQEVYSVAIVLKELLGSFSGYDINILGVDISEKAIAQASYGHFSQLELARGLPPAKLARHFEPDRDRWKIRDELRALASFRRTNLLEPIATPTPFDIILCRNVAIYFTEPDKIRLFRNMGNMLAGDGVLLIGATESITGLCPEFEPKRYLRSVYYQKSSSSMRTSMR
jgi:chemotaxis protein methyltransferase CheR